MTQSQKIVTFGVSKISNGYLGINTDWFDFLRLWQMMPKIIE